jgi:hypothetical protein
MTKVTLKHVGVLSIAKWLTLFMFIVGIFAGIFYGVTLLFYGMADAKLIIFYTISLPITYSLVGFIASVIGGFIYNALAGSIGGMVLELENVGSELLPPPPPKEF